VIAAGADPLVSVIVPVRDARKPLDATVEALLAQSLPRDRYEVIVVENDAQGVPAAADLRRRGVVVIRETSAASAYVARNAGLAVARGAVVAFTDADCVPAPDWLERGVAALERERADLAAGAIRFTIGRPRSAAMVYDATHFLQAGQAVAERSVAFMANLFARRRVLDALGGLPTASISGGDVRFTREATRAGFRLVYAADAVVSHPARDWRAMVVKALRVGYGKGRLARHRAGRDVVRVEMLATPQVRSLNPLALYRRVRRAALSVRTTTALRTVAFGYVVAACALAGFVAGLVRPGRRAAAPRAPEREDAAGFALVVEAINLGLADRSRLARCLDSLAAQTLPVARARQVLLVHGGEIPEDALRDACDRFPWLTLHAVPAGTGYEEAKAIGAARIAAPLVVFADSDCTYDPDWLARLLEPFRDPAVDVVGGETAIAMEGAYGLAVAMTFSFDGFTQATAPYDAGRFHFNNVAFRAPVLAAHPIRFGEPVYRCPRLYATTLRRAGVRIRRQPGARAHHAPPNGIEHFFWRYLFLGHDAVAYRRIVGAEGDRRERPDWSAEVLHRLRRAQAVLTPRRLLLLPLAAPIVAAAVVLGFAGALVRAVSPSFLLRVAPARVLDGSSFDRRVLARRAPWAIVRSRTR